MEGQNLSCQFFSNSFNSTTDDPAKVKTTFELEDYRFNDRAHSPRFPGNPRLPLCRRCYFLTFGPTETGDPDEIPNAIMVRRVGCAAGACVNSARFRRNLSGTAHCLKGQAGHRIPWPGQSEPKKRHPMQQPCIFTAHFRHLRTLAACLQKINHPLRLHEPRFL